MKLILFFALEVFFSFHVLCAQPESPDNLSNSDDYNKLSFAERLRYQQQNIATNRMKLMPVDRKQLSFNEVFRKLELEQYILVMPDFPRYENAVANGVERRFNTELKFKTPDSTPAGGELTTDFVFNWKYEIKAQVTYHDTPYTLDILKKYTYAPGSQTAVFSPAFKENTPENIKTGFWMGRSMSMRCALDSQIILSNKTELKIRKSLGEFLGAGASTTLGSAQTFYRTFQANYNTAQISVPISVDQKVVMGSQGLLDICKRFSDNQSIRDRLWQSLKVQVVEYLTSANLANTCDNDNDCTNNLSYWHQGLLSMKGQTYKCLKHYALPGIKTCQKRSLESSWCSDNGVAYPKCAGNLTCVLPRVTENGVSCYSGPLGTQGGGCPAAINPHVGLCMKSR